MLRQRKNWRCLLGFHRTRFAGFQCERCSKRMIGLLDQEMPRQRRVPSKRHTLTQEDWDA